MRLLLAALLAQAPAAPGPLIGGRVIDATVGGPVVAASVAAAGARTVTRADGRFTLVARAGDTVRVHRIGYRPAMFVAGAAPIVVHLVPEAVPLVPVVVRDTARAARLSADRSVSTLREAGITSVDQGLARLPFVSARSARGEQMLSLRGSRANQVAVTLDGLPLNNPATGEADVSGIPLAVLGTMTVTPGADAARAGSGASGGVVALTSGDRPTLATGLGAFGLRTADGAAQVPLAGGAVRLAAGWSEARNDFPFVNHAGATGTDSVERRVNNDEHRLALFATALVPGAQVLALASRDDRGLVGPMNVRAFDHDRGRDDRLFVRVATEGGTWMWVTTMRAFALQYHDPLHPVLDSRARVLSGDVEVARAWAGVSTRAGAGIDGLTGTALSPTERPRAFFALSDHWVRSCWRIVADTRADAVRESGVQPSWTLSMERTGPSTLFARLAQGFRVPTLYDRYMASAQRLIVRDLRPERVTLDAELGARLTTTGSSVEAAVFQRQTRDAIVWFPGNFAWSPQNVPRESARGAEGRATATLGDLELGIWAGVYRTRLDVGPLTMPTPYVPYAAGGASAVMRGAASMVVATLRAIGGRPYASAPAAADDELPGVVLVDLHVGHHLAVARRQALISVGADNLGGRQWEPVRGYPAPGRAWSFTLTLDP